MTAATDKELSELHKKVASTLMKQLSSTDTAQILLDEHGADLPDEVREYLEEQVGASPALLKVCTGFLKDNGITAVIEESKEMSDLEKRLAEKSKRKAVGTVVPIREDY